MTKVVLFNSPANSGKDFACEYLSRQYGVFHFSFKQRLIEITKAIYGLTDEDVFDISQRKCKELQFDCLKGLSWRQALIKVSEEMVKPVLGNDYFGEAALDNLISNGYTRFRNDVVACSDCGFVDEVTPLVDYYGGENILLVRIEADGCSFRGDSRSYIEHPNIPDENYITLFNKKDEFFYDDLDWIYAFISR